jgi:hypothetical protein
MRLTTAIVISGLTVIVGVLFKQSYSWIPLLIFIASIVEIYTRKWVSSDKVGTNPKISIVGKFLFALIGMVALFGQVICLGLIIFWFIN